MIAEGARRDRAARRARLHGGAARDGIGSRSLMRSLAGARSFARFLERNGKGKVGALSAVRAPKVPKTLPKPLAVSVRQAADRADLRAGEEREPGCCARDAAVLALLYGSGLRISEALGLTREAVPRAGQGRRDHRAAARATRRAWCRCCRRCCN
jgi:site-specific recombinase XerC